VSSVTGAGGRSGFRKLKTGATIPWWESAAVELPSFSLIIGFDGETAEPIKRGSAISAVTIQIAMPT
jgi:hypothetical protein